MVKQYRKKPVVIEALQWVGGPVCRDEMEAFVGDGMTFGHDGPLIETLEGHLTVSHLDWVIRGVEGEFYPCKPDIFDKTYDAVDGGE